MFLAVASFFNNCRGTFIVIKARKSVLLCFASKSVLFCVSITCNGRVSIHSFRIVTISTRSFRIEARIFQFPVLTSREGSGKTHKLKKGFGWLTGFYVVHASLWQSHKRVPLSRRELFVPEIVISEHFGFLAADRRTRLINKLMQTKPYKSVRDGNVSIANQINDES